MTTITAHRAHNTDFAERIARRVGLVLAVVIIASLLIVAGTALSIDLPVLAGLFNACSQGTSALNGASVALADGWAACGPPVGPDADFGQAFTTN